MGFDPLTAMMVLSVGSGVLGARSANKQAQANADAAIQQGNLELAKMEKQGKALKKATLSQIGSQKTSFLSSGLSLDGTPSDVMGETYEYGIEDLMDLNTDIRTISSAYNQKSKNYITSGRSEAMNKLASGVSSAAMMGFGGGYLDNGFGFGSKTITAEIGSSPNILPMGVK